MLLLITVNVVNTIVVVIVNNVIGNVGVTENISLKSRCCNIYAAIIAAVVMVTIVAVVAIVAMVVIVAVVAIVAMVTIVAVAAIVLASIVATSDT